jgi:Luciferase
MAGNPRRNGTLQPDGVGPSQAVLMKQDENVSDWRPTFWRRCRYLGDGAVGDSAFGSGAALWVGKREIAHFDDEHTLDIRLTKHAIRDRRRELTANARIHLRRGHSDWLEIRIEDQSDFEYALTLVRDAILANRASAPPGPPPTGSELERRRRLH